jgi:hypothetical protein
MTQYECIPEYEALSEQARNRLLADVQKLGADCAHQAHRQGLNVPYTTAARGDVDALARLLEQYGVHELPYGYTGPGWRHPIWDAFWAGVETTGY